MKERLPLTAAPMLSTIQQLQNNFSSATGLAVVLLEQDGTPMTKLSGQTQLYDTITRNADGKKLYEASVQKLCQLAQQMGKPCQITCEHTGLLMGALPVITPDRHMANWMVGQVREDIHLDHYTLFALNLAVATGLPSVELSMQYSALPALSHYAFGLYFQLLQSINLLCLPCVLPLFEPTFP